MDHVPVFDDFPVVEPEEIIIGDMLAWRGAKLPFAHRENEVPLAKDLVSFVIDHDHVIGGEIGEGLAKTV